MWYDLGEDSYNCEVRSLTRSRQKWHSWIETHVNGWPRAGRKAGHGHRGTRSELARTFMMGRHGNEKSEKTLPFLNITNGPVAVVYIQEKGGW